MNTQTFENIEQARTHAMQLMQSDDNEQIVKTLSHILTSYPQDGQLLFLYASILAQQQQYDQAMEQFVQAVNYSPDFHIARFQLCLLAASTEKFELLEQHLAPLVALKDSHYLGYFANALALVFNDQLEQAAILIEQGIAINQENPALNHDMHQMLDRIKGSETEIQVDDEQTQSTNSVTSSVLLDIYKNTH